MATTKRLLYVNLPLPPDNATRVLTSHGANTIPSWDIPSGGSGSLPPFAGVDGAVVVETGNPTPIAIFRRLTADDIDPAFAISSFSRTAGGPATLEIGEEIVNPQFAASYPSALAGATLADGVDVQAIASPYTAFGYGAPGLFAPRTYFKLVPNQTVNWHLAATKLGGSPTAGADVSAVWQAVAFFGFSITGTFNEAFIEALPATPADRRKQAAFNSNTYAFGIPPAVPTNYLWVALPTAWGDPSIWKDSTGDTFPMSKVASGISVTNAAPNPATITYELWRSDNPISGFAFTLTAQP